MTFRNLLSSLSPQFSCPCWSGNCSIPKYCCQQEIPKEPQLHFPSRKTPLGAIPVLSRGVFAAACSPSLLHSTPRAHQVLWKKPPSCFPSLQPLELPGTPGSSLPPYSGAGFSLLLLRHFPRHVDPSNEWLCWNSSGNEELPQHPAGASSG